MRRLNPRSAFTLIELLVVIAIIAILAAILFPVFAQAKEAAKKASDLSNFKQVSLGVQMYTIDFDDLFPMLRNGRPNWQAVVTGPQVNSGHIMVNPYVKNKAIWKSPNDTMGRCDSTSTGSSQSENHPTGGVLSYVFSYYDTRSDVRPYAFGLHAWDSVSVSTGQSLNPSRTSLSTTAVGSPAQTIHIMPSYISWSYWNGLMQHRNDQREYAFDDMIPTWPRVLQLANVWCATDFMSIGAYSGQSNWGFADGHVKSMRREQIMDRLWRTDPATANAQNRRNLIHWDERFKN
ncbi:MAG: prepilin-type N-terminal cleavage/methylation domain-containing protein [Fimbriimonadaceae bacterium]